MLTQPDVFLPGGSVQVIFTDQVLLKVVGVADVPFLFSHAIGAVYIGGGTAAHLALLESAGTVVAVADLAVAELVAGCIVVDGLGTLLHQAVAAGSVQVCRGGAADDLAGAVANSIVAIAPGLGVLRAAG